MSASNVGPREAVRVLLLEDNPVDAELCIRRLKRTDLNAAVDVARYSKEFMERVQSQAYDIVLTDYRLPGWNGLDALYWLRSVGRDIPVILVTGTLGDELAIECIKAGVSDYVLKDNLERLPVAIRRTLQEHDLRDARDRAEEELRLSEERYRLLFNANPHPMWVYDRQTLRFLMVNDAAIRHYGYSLKEFLSMTVKEIRPPEELDRFLASVSQTRKRLSSRELWKHRKKDGTIIDVEISDQVITFRAVDAELVLAHDVTAQRRAEAEVRAGREQLQLLLDSTAEAICAVDLNGVCTLCNTACLRLLGYNQESDLLAKNMHSLMHHTHSDGRPYPEEECKIHQAVRLGSVTYAMDEVFWRADGTSFPVEYWSYPIRHENRLVGSVVTFIDISERKNAEKQLRRSESRYRSIIERAPYGIFRVNEQGRIVMANRAFVVMLGYGSENEVLGLAMSNDIYQDPAERERVLAAFSPEGSSVAQETKWVRKDKKTIMVRLAGRQLSSDDELSGGYEVFVEDITETRSLQKQFEHAQRMEAVGRLAGGVAHDFNNVLMVISGYAQLLQESSADTEKLSQYAIQIREASTKAAAITRQLLAFSRKQVVDPAVLDLNSIIKDLGKMLPRLLGEDIDLRIILDPQLGTVRADRTQMEQVIMNLAVNARDALPKGGRLTIETSNVELDAAYDRRPEVSVPAGRYVLLTASDTGIGMSVETQLHIFEPFFTTKETGKGTGLGLATVYGIVKQSHGFIWVYSELGKGSSFKIYLPRLDVPAASEGRSETELAPGGTETILLVEDDPTLRQVSRVYLESKGYIVLQAENASEALKLCQSDRHIDLLISDLVMPGLGGVELAQSAVALRPSLSVVLVSGYTDRMLDMESIGIEAHFLQKPCSLDALARLARALLDKRQDGKM